LMQLSVDTSWWLRYRSRQNPDLGATFPPLIPSLAVGQHTAIPRNNSELGDPNNISHHVQAIANTAGFHFAFIEQGGSSLYAAMAQKVTSPGSVANRSEYRSHRDGALSNVARQGGKHSTRDRWGFGLSRSEQSFSGEAVAKNLIMPEPCKF